MGLPIVAMIASALAQTGAQAGASKLMGEKKPMQSGGAAGLRALGSGVGNQLANRGGGGGGNGDLMGMIQQLLQKQGGQQKPPIM
uniref:Uncharacterized protein n=1 Tax=viral metagenome TaxID=1070528 RepID=A0A6M3IUB4_9ZZZZ